MERKYYIDKLRVFATFCVIILHVSAGNWAYLPVFKYEWQVLNFYNGAVRFCVPIFFMITGALMLDDNYDFSIKKLFKKNIFRIFTAFAFWSLFYVVTNIVNGENSIKTLIKSFVLGHYHMWFLYAIAFIYFLIPVFRKICVDKKTTEYFILIAFFFVFGLNMLEIFNFTDFFGTYVQNSSKINLGYIPYVFVGYFISKNRFSAKNTKILYFLGCVSIFITIFLTKYVSIKQNLAVSTFYSYLMPNVFFVSVFIFLLFKNLFNNKKSDIITNISKYCFGIYLIHPFVLSLIYKFITILSFNQIYSVLIISILAFFVSLIIIYFISKIPFLNKYII